MNLREQDCGTAQSLTILWTRTHIVTDSSSLSRGYTHGWSTRRYMDMISVSYVYDTPGASIFLSPVYPE